MYKNNMYIAFSTLDEKWMMVVYNPKDDAWSNLNLSQEETYYSPYEGRLIIADDCLFFVSVDNYYFMDNNTIAIFNTIVIDLASILINIHWFHHDVKTHELRI